MDVLVPFTSFGLFVLACLVTLMAGVIKGAVGFGLPMLMISGMSAFVAPELALATLIMPTLFTNVWQSLRQGWRAALQSIVNYRVFLISGLITLVLSAQWVPILPRSLLYLIVGLPVSVFAVMQLIGWQAKLTERSAARDAMVGGVAGFFGGLSGVWGPPTVAYLTAVNTPKTEQIRVQGTIYGLGAIALLGAHIQSGVLRAETLPLSMLMVVPAIAGMWLGMAVQDRINQATFRKITLIVLLFAGLNLIRRGILG